MHIPVILAHRTTEAGSSARTHVLTRLTDSLFNPLDRTHHIFNQLPAWQTGAFTCARPTLGGNAWRTRRAKLRKQ
jgi:hypothetical protein